MDGDEDEDDGVCVMFCCGVMLCCDVMLRFDVVCDGVSDVVDVG